MVNNSLFKTIKESLLSGLCISIGGIVYLKSGSLFGTILFAFALATIICFRWPLFTGMAGFADLKGHARLFGVLVINLLGCLICSYMASSSEVVRDASEAIIRARVEAGALNDFMMSIFCGFIMTASVKFARQGKWLPLLLGIPTFIISGFPHCIADSFYIFSCRLEVLESFGISLIWYYLSIVAGNYVGCNLWRVGGESEPLAA